MGPESDACGAMTAACGMWENMAIVYRTVLNKEPKVYVTTVYMLRWMMMGFNKRGNTGKTRKYQ